MNLSTHTFSALNTPAIQGECPVHSLVQHPLAPGGPWDRLLKVRAVAALDPQYCRQAVQQLCAFIDETAEAFVSLDCGS